MTTLAELLVRDGRWPTLDGPWGYPGRPVHAAPDIIYPKLWPAVKAKLDRLRGDYWLPAATWSRGPGAKLTRVKLTGGRNE